MTCYNPTSAMSRHGRKMRRHGDCLRNGLLPIGLKCIGYEIISQIIWIKDQYALSRGDYHWRHEPCWYAVKKGARHNWQGARDQCTVWQINRVDKNEDAYGHSTQKPIECMARPIQNNTLIGEIVVDPFLGSGTTLVACEQTGRIGCGIEIEPKYISVSLERLSLLGLDCQKVNI